MKKVQKARNNTSIQVIVIGTTLEALKVGILNYKGPFKEMIKISSSIAIEAISIEGMTLNSILPN